MPSNDVQDKSNTHIRFWIDKWGVVWTRSHIGGYLSVWNRFAGIGLWDGGRGLEPYYGVHSEASKRSLGL